ncbi:hypothetical protein [Streptomyces dubilierae]|uniref:Uncharacterized protein n=1 Tax=Streptomyces dubilierae TaxID=3075533 RepID=A0ABU2P6L6_9ACTN|nr:hypothetical protein [Streptomyces sp. DSM 41921]MDT0387791.1 hypothetical protein [Streptomyces sp. DSM 41921]
MTLSASPTVETPWWDAYVRLSDHCVTCPTCTAVDQQGTNLRLPCTTARQLSEEHRQAWRT